MRHTVLFILIILVTSCQRNNNLNADSPIIINAEVLRTFDSIYVRDSMTRQTYELKLSIKNVSDKSISYWTMNCSWPENWLTNKDNYWIVWSMECDANYVRTRRLNPDEIYTNYTFVCKNEYEQLYRTDNKLKLGFIYIDTIVCKDRKDFKNFMGDRSTQKIIWSNPLDLK